MGRKDGSETPVSRRTDRSELTDPTIGVPTRQTSPIVPFLIGAVMGLILVGALFGVCAMAEEPPTRVVVSK